jgi:hypothetical protein
MKVLSMMLPLRKPLMLRKGRRERAGGESKQKQSMCDELERRVIAQEKLCICYNER